MFNVAGKSIHGHFQLLWKFCLVNSKQSLYLFEGDDLLKKTTEEMENLNLDMVWDVLDWYQTAIVLTRGNDVELEAEITCRIGYVYSKVL